MARYFRYRTLQEIAADAAARGLQVYFQEDLSPLWRPVPVAGRVARNSVAIHPMEGCDGTPEGRPDELTFRRWQRYGASGAAIIWGEATAVVPEGRANPRQLLLNTPNAEAFERLLKACRQAHRSTFGQDSGLLVGIQLTHSGRYAVPRPLPVFHDPLLDPLTWVDRSRGETLGSDYPIVSDDYLDRLQDRFVAAAKLAFQIGFDFVDLKQCHRYLLSELLAAKLRPGKYGGSLENRTRWIREVVGRIRQEVPQLILATRLNVFDGIPFQKNPATGVGEPVSYETPVRSGFGVWEEQPLEMDLTEPIALVRLLRTLGVSLVSVTMGNPYAAMHLTRPFEYPPVDGYESPEHPLVGVDRHFRAAEAVQRAEPELVVMGSGYSWLQQYLFAAAAANLARSRVRVVGLGRASLAYPDAVRQLQEGHPLDPKRLCRTFSYCTALMRSKHHPLGQFPTGCPPFDRSVYGPIWEEAKRAEGYR
jgi:NADPH2 dehydrogenase